MTALTGMTKKDYQYLSLCRDEGARFSTCSRRQYFAIIVDRWGHILGTGYNGVPSGMTHCVDGGCPRGNTNVAHGSNYAGNCWATHAEANALLHSDYTARRDGCTLYVNGPPCWQCAVLIANGSISRLVCIEDGVYEQWSTILAFLRQCVEVQTINAGEL